MPKRELISTAKSAADLDKAYASANTALKKLGIAMVSKKPDAKKLAPLMAKGAKAEFVLFGDKHSVQLRCDVEKNYNVLGIYDLAKEKAKEKAKAIAESLVKAGLLDKKDVQSFIDGH